MGREPLPEEVGADLELDPPDIPPEEVWHDVETVENEDYYDTERCTACGKADRMVWPMECCPAKELSSDNQRRIEARAELARERDCQLTYYETVGARTDSMSGIPSRRP